MQRLFSTFPAGGPGVGLLLLRLVLGGSLLAQGAAWSDGRGVLASGCGALLVVGFLTPLAALAAGLLIAGAAAGGSAAASPLFGSTLSVCYGVVVALAVALLGPGALSLDARRFGRRELIVPRRNSQ